MISNAPFTISALTPRELGPGTVCSAGPRPITSAWRRVPAATLPVTSAKLAPVANVGAHTAAATSAGATPVMCVPTVPVMTVTVPTMAILLVPFVAAISPQERPA